MFLKAKRISLDALDPEKHREYVTRWINDPEVTKFMVYGQLPMTEHKIMEMLESQVANPANVVFLVRHGKKAKPIGFAGLYDIHLTARKAEFRILIGERSAWGKGIGTEVTKVITDYAFDRLNLHRVWLGVTSENAGAVRAYEKAGYVREGVLKDDIWRNGRWYDSIRMAVIRQE